MHKFLGILVFILIFNCSNKREILLPEIENATITEVLDVSAAYIFYDESEPDSTLLNRKNLISTTNWLVNVDRRLTLRQAIPHIRFLQDKKRGAKMHKNEKAKNYFSCSDTENRTLGFLDFTEVNYKSENPDFIKFTKENPGNYLLIKVGKTKKVKLIAVNEDFKTEVAEDIFLSDFNKLSELVTSQNPQKIVLFFHQELSFQDYVSLKHVFNHFNSSDFNLLENEYLFS